MGDIQRLEFGSGRLMGFLGLIAGAAIAIGVPWIVLSNSGSAGLGSFAVCLLSILGIVGGVAVAIATAVLSIVTPKKIDQGGNDVA